MILVAGSANLDFVVRADHIPAPGETILGHSLATYPGGKGANQAVAAARAGGTITQMLLALGDDAHAQPLEQSLQSAGVYKRISCAASRHATGTAFICVSRDAENAITVAPGANMLLAPEHLPPLDGFSHLLMQLETPLATVAAYARAARAAGVKVVLNAAPAQPLDAQLLGLIDILIVNQGELASITGLHGSVREGLARLQVPLVVVTLGARGCCAHEGTDHFLQPAFAVEPGRHHRRRRHVLRRAGGRARPERATGRRRCAWPARPRHWPVPGRARNRPSPTRPKSQTSCRASPPRTSAGIADLRAYCGLAD